VRLFISLRDTKDPQVILIVFSVVNPASYNAARGKVNLFKCPPTILRSSLAKWNYELRREYPGVPRLLVGMDNELRQDEDMLAKLKEGNISPIPYNDAKETARQLDCVG